MQHSPSRRLVLVLSCLVFLVALAVWNNPAETQETVKPAKVDDKIQHQPSAVPDRIILNWQGDPARSQAVSWRTSSQVTRALAEIAPAQPDAAFVRVTRQVPAKTTVLKTDLHEVACHSVAFENLEPKTTYAYRVGDGANWSEFFQFTTAAAASEPFSFIYFGDAQNDLKSHWSRVIRQAYRDAPYARFLLHAGDLINSANRDAEWGDWFRAGGWVNGSVPSVCVTGNHEYAKIRIPDETGKLVDAPKIPGPDGGMIDQRKLSHHWRAQFALPENGPDSLLETVYYLDYQGVRFIVLNSNERIREQAQWLERVLMHNPSRWTIVAFHHPVFSGAKDRDNPLVREQWKPILDKYRVDLVLQGHDHLYARSGLEVPGVNIPSGVNAQSLEGGTVYVVSVSGPKMYNMTKRPDYWKRVAEDVQLYQVITVDGDTLKYVAKNAVGELYDAFTLKKQAGDQPNLLQNEIPPVAESRRPPAPEKKTSESEK